MGNFDGKRVLITGGSSGIGAAAARAFLREGAAVTIAGRSRKGLDAAVARHPGITTVEADVRKPSDCRRAVEAAAAVGSGLDILVNSAGIYSEGPSDAVTEELWDSVMDTNLKGTFFMCRYAIPYLAESRGTIINISSDSGLVGNNEAAVYCASKGGVTLLTKALAVELAARGIRVNAVCPGIVETPMVEKDFAASGYQSREEYDRICREPYPPGTDRYVLPAEAAEAVLFLADRRRVESINGACLSVDFGLTAGY